MAGNKAEEMEDVEKKEDGVVEEIPPELQIKHPLQNTWTLWYYENDRNKNWEENQREITSFDTAEDFWSLYNHIKMASELRQGCDYSLFKHGIRPMWEDEANKRGGRWLINLSKNQRGNELDKYWLEILLCLIGEAFDEHSEDICGAVVNIRSKGDKIGVWTADAGRQNSVIEIGAVASILFELRSSAPWQGHTLLGRISEEKLLRVNADFLKRSQECEVIERQHFQHLLQLRKKLKQRLSIGHNVVIGYQIHKDTMVKAGSVTKNTYTV